MDARERATKALVDGIDHAVFVPTEADEASWRKFMSIFEHPELPRDQWGKPKTLPVRGVRRRYGPDMASRILQLLDEAGLAVVER